jgi:very-long-chain enoyl-CoA reductase
MVLLPDWTPFQIAVHAVFVIYALAIGPLVDAELLHMRYSKFRTGGGISSRAGMFILYFVPIVVLLVTAFLRGILPQASWMQGLLLVAVALHFSKRCLEVLFLHAYSGPIDRLTVALVTANYSLVTALVAVFVVETPAPGWPLVLGLALFTVGQAGNFHHHRLLKRLRLGREGYSVPEGGLFSRVSSPHYLFELVAWLGFALMGQHLVFWIIFATMTHYLFHRAAHNHAWYLERFPDYPPGRRRILPGIF